MDTNQRRWISLAIVLTAPLLSVIDVFIVNVAIPTIQQSLKANNAQMQLVVAGYLLGYASFMVMGGRAGDLYGRKKVFFWSMFAFTITSAACGLAQTPDQLNLARFFQGISASFMVPQTVSYMQLLFTKPKERTIAIGFYGMTLGIASTLGQFLGGYFSSGDFFTAGWRLIFFINIPVGLLSLWAVRQFLLETTFSKTAKFDYPGTALLVLSLVSFIYPLVQGREAGWPVWCFVSLAVSLALIYFFIQDQKTKSRRHQSPLIDTVLFSYRDFNLGLLAVVCYFIFHTSYLFISTLHFQQTLGLSASQTGLSFVWLGFGFTLASLLSIQLVNRFGKATLQAGVVLIGTMMVVQSIAFEKTVGSVAINSVLLLQGIGMGLVLPSLMNFALKSVPARLAGAASGVYSTFQQVSSALGITLVGGLYFFIREAALLAENPLLSYQVSLGADLGFLALLALALWRLPAYRQAPKEEAALVH